MILCGRYEEKNESAELVAEEAEWVRLVDLAMGTSLAAMGTGCEADRLGIGVGASLTMKGGRSRPWGTSSSESRRGVIDSPKKESRLLDKQMGFDGARGKPQAFIRVTLGSSTGLSLSGSGVAGVTIGVGIDA